jgi:hypothetical protein
VNIRTTLASFYKACTAELTTSPNDKVKLIYDTYYTVSPMRSAICSKDDSGAYCGANASGKDSAQAAQKFLGTTADGITSPNATTWVNNNVAFLFISKALSNSDCSVCTRNVANSYLTWESNASYGPGLGSSTLLKGQTDILSAINSVCGANFIGGSVNAAGGIGDSIAGKANGAATVKAGSAVATFVGAVFAAVALF